MASLNYDFGKRLSQRLQELGWSGRELARKVGINKNSVSKYLARGGVPEWDILVKLSGLLGVTTDWLLTGRDPPVQGPCRLGVNNDPLLKLFAQDPELEEVFCDYAEAKVAGQLPEAETAQLETDLKARAFYLVSRAKKEPPTTKEVIQKLG